MMVNNYIPQKGDLLTLQFTPQAGHEQQGPFESLRDRFPALVISNYTLNQAVGMAIVCPLTKTKRGIPFHIPVPEGTGMSGYIMAEQVKSVDYKARRALYVSDAPQATVDDVLAVLDACLYQ